MSTESLSAFKFASSYGRYLPDLKRREVPSEAFERVIEMHRTKYKAYDIEGELAFALQAMKDGLVLGSQRALQFGGAPILRRNERIYNCSSSYCDRPRFFQECLWMLLCGCGTGFSVQKHHVAKLPPMIPPLEKAPATFVIPDTCEGWADALGVLMASYGIASPEHRDWVGSTVSFDYSQVRPKGSSISTGSGKAPGPEPLRIALEQVRGVLQRRIASFGVDSDYQLRPIDAYDVVMHASDAVLAGGVRRSATICLFSVADEEMRNAKTGDWQRENPQRGRSNNSAVLLRHDTSWEQFSDLFMQARRQYGEPGFVWADSTEITYNPCVEIGLYPAITKRDMHEVLFGKTWQANGHGVAEGDELLSGWASCVSGDTDLLTANGVIKIADAVGKPTTIWNGESWKTVTPFVTGTNRPLYRVELSDGSFLDCTAEHKWLVKDRFMAEFVEVETQGLLGVSKYAVHVPSGDVTETRGTVEEPQAYELGFILGDGSVDPEHGPGRARATLYGAKIDLPLEGVRRGVRRIPGYGVDGQDIIFDVDVVLAARLKGQPDALDELHSWTKDSILSFVAGWADADGSQAGRGIRVYGPQDRCRKLQLLLRRCGLLSSVNFCDDGDTNFGARNYAIWYVQITDCATIPCHRLDVSKGHTPRCKGRQQIIRSVTELPGLHTTYCLTEDEKHTCVFNNVLTKQCNLCEINSKACKTVEDWERATRAAAILGTLQAGYTSFSYLGPVSEAIAKREALLGVSMTGMMDNPKFTFDPEFQRDMAQRIVTINGDFAPRIGVLPTARATCVKPAGSTSCILGTSSGIHPHHARRYFRRAQANELEAPLQFYEMHNPGAVERSVWSKSGTDRVVTFCIEVHEDALTRRQVDGLKQLEFVKLTQENWVAAGTVKHRCAQSWLRHNVSNTISITVGQQEQAARYIYDHRDSFAGVSILDTSGDLDYVQAPFCEVRYADELLEDYGDGVFFASGLIVDGLHAFGNNLWLACDAALGITEVKAPEYPSRVDLLPDAIKKAYDEVYTQKRDWVRRARQFASRYFGFEPGDLKNAALNPQDYAAYEKAVAPLRRMTYCLKEVSNLKRWNDLTREHQPVDFTKMIEGEDGTVNVVLDAACAGGSCSMQLA